MKPSTMQTVTGASLHHRLAKLEERHDDLARLVMRALRPVTNVSMSSPYTIQGKVVNAAIELVLQTGRAVSSGEIFDSLTQKGINLGGKGRQKALLAAILRQEVTKRSARLVRVARALYDLR